MSGFEIVGVVLGALPLVIEAANGLEFYIQGIKAAWFFRRHFKGFIREVTLQEVFFIQNLDLLLVPLDISDRERQSLKSHQSSRLWNHPDILWKISRYHQEASRICVRLLRELNDSLKELYTILPIKDGKVNAHLKTHFMFPLINRE